MKRKLKNLAKQAGKVLFCLFLIVCVTFSSVYRPPVVYAASGVVGADLLWSILNAMGMVGSSSMFGSGTATAPAPGSDWYKFMGKLEDMLTIAPDPDSLEGQFINQERRAYWNNLIQSFSGTAPASVDLTQAEFNDVLTCFSHIKENQAIYNSGKLSMAELDAKYFPTGRNFETLVSGGDRSFDRAMGWYPAFVYDGYSNGNIPTQFKNLTVHSYLVSPMINPGLTSADEAHLTSVTFTLPIDSNHNVKILYSLTDTSLAGGISKVYYDNTEIDLYGKLRLGFSADTVQLSVVTFTDKSNISRSGVFLICNIPDNSYLPSIAYHELPWNGSIDDGIAGLNDEVLADGASTLVNDFDTWWKKVVDAGIVSNGKVNVNIGTGTQAGALGDDIATAQDKTDSETYNKDKDIPADIPKPKPGEMPDLTLPNMVFTKFPFCIPWDLYNAVANLVAPPVPPKFKIPFIHTQIFGKKIDVDIELDLAPYDKLAQISRWGFSLLFLIGLILLSRKIVKV